MSSLYGQMFKSKAYTYKAIQVLGCVRCYAVRSSSYNYVFPQKQLKLRKLSLQIYTPFLKCERHSSFFHQSLSILSTNNAYSNGTQVRWYSQPNPKKSFFSELFDSIKQEMTKNKEMKESLKKFRSDYEKLEQSDALKKAREKFDSIQAETGGGTDKLKKGLSSIQEKIKETAEDLEKSEIGKKGKQFAEDLSKTAGKTAETIYRQGEQISKTKVVQKVSEGAKVIKSELDEATMPKGRLYKPPAKLMMREEVAVIKQDDKEYEADTESTGVQLHKDSKWYQSWQNFKDNNQFVNKMFDMKTRYDESDNVVIRATRTFTDKFTELFGGVFTKTEMSEVLTEVVKMDPTFSQERFIQDCKTLYIPNILEAMVRGELEVLEDWCYEAAYNTIAHPIKQAKQAGYIIKSQVLDINHVDVVAGKMMEQGPVIVISFLAQQLMYVKDSKGTLVEGEEEKIMRMFYVWAFCRDQAILDPRTAWRLIDLSASPSEQFI